MRTRIPLTGSLLTLIMLFSTGCGSTTPTPTPTPTPTQTLAPTPTPTPAAAPLGKLDVQVTSGGGGTLTPAFASDTTEYALKIQSDISGIGVVPTLPAGSTAKITVDGKDAKSGEPASIAPPVGDSKVKVVVSAADGKSTTYTVTVTREDIQPVVDKFLKLTYQDPATGVLMGYRLFVPENLDKTKTYPLVLFLHGVGELGSDNEAQITANQGATVWAKPEEQAKHPCFVLAPQSNKDPAADFAKGNFGKIGWTSLMTNGPVVSAAGNPFQPLDQLVTAYDILKKVIGDYNVDPKRVYATGLSMGGFGAFAITIAHPNLFAALVPVASGGDPTKLSTIATIPTWIFHAEEDPVIPVKFSRDSNAALKAADGYPKYTEFPKGTYFFPIAHFSWVPAYANSEMRDWLFQQSK